MRKSRRSAFLSLTIILILMSFGTILTKLGLQDISPITLTWTSVGCGLIAMLIYTFGIKGEKIPKMSKNAWSYIILIGLLNFVLARFTGIYSLSLLPATTNTYLVNFVGFITMGLSIFMLNEKPSKFQLLGAVISFVGLRVFFSNKLEVRELLGVLIVLIGIIGIAITNNLTRKLAIITNNEISNNIVSTLAITIGGSMVVLFGLITDLPLRVKGISDWGIILYIGVVSIALCLTVWNKNLRVLRSYEASILGASGVIWTALLAIPILHEKLSIYQVIGIGFLIMGLVMVQFRTVNIHKTITKSRTIS